MGKLHAQRMRPQCGRSVLQLCSGCGKGKSAMHCALYTVAVHYSCAPPYGATVVDACRNTLPADQRNASGSPRLAEAPAAIPHIVACTGCRRLMMVLRHFSGCRCASSQRQPCRPHVNMLIAPHPPCSRLQTTQVRATVHGKRHDGNSPRCCALRRLCGCAIAYPPAPSRRHSPLQRQTSAGGTMASFGRFDVIAPALMARLCVRAITD